VARPGEGRVVLVVDDERAVRVAAKAFLETKGFEVHTAGDLSGALRVLGERSVDVALVDVRIPGSSSGLRVVEVIGRWFPNVARVLMTGELDLAAELDAALVGVRIFEKSVFLDDLVRIVLEAAEERDR
jgi:two-component system response regulator RegA